MAVADQPRLDSTATHPARRPHLLPGLALLAAFAAIELWFGKFDFYHRDFFQPGWCVLADNLFRIGFTAILFWLVCAPGYALLGMVLRERRSDELPITERILLGFGLGVGLWHVVMLALGVAGLYDRWLIIGIAGIVLLASVRHFGEVADAARAGIAGWRADLHRGSGTIEATGTIAIAIALALVLLVRGLYPGGGGDYYTHYFPYYLAVLKNHGLAPNDVWYHYFYSKGAGLVFLGMLLTDPEAPALTTFCCVAAAALAILVLGRRLAPRSLWPAAGTVLYLLYCLISFDRSGGGEFPKDHELISALVALMVWAMCMRRLVQQRAFLFAAVSCGVAASIATQPMGILLGVCIAVLAAIQLARRQWSQLGESLVLGSAIGVTVLGILLLGYVTVGLATDQPLDLMLRFANIPRLDQLGLLPQLVLTEWIRHNYTTIAPPLGRDSLTQLWRFARFDLLWLWLAGSGLLAAAALVTVASRQVRAATKTCAAAASSPHLTVLGIVSAFVVPLLAVSVFAGRVQYVSYERFSTFFVPLLILLALAGCGWALGQIKLPLTDWLVRLGLPVVLVIGTLVAWQSDHYWVTRLIPAAGNGVAFLDGQYSLADAYAHQDSGYSFGGINPEALAAARQLPPDTPIWSTDTAEYCMAPRCHIESVASFKMSGQLDQILTGPPEQAEQLLRAAGLNYFLVTVTRPLTDLLPYSRLFAPDTMGDYLGVKWTDGSAYLLTWKGPGIAPLGPRFLAAYTRQVHAAEGPWFDFRTLVTQIDASTAVLRAHRQFGQPVVWPWAHAPKGGIDIVSATYGGNCRDYVPTTGAPNTVWHGNVTWYVQRACRNGKECRFPVDVIGMGDPAQGCGKEFSVTYRCSAHATQQRVVIPPEADGKMVTIDCTGGH